MIRAIALVFLAASARAMAPAELGSTMSGDSTGYSDSGLYGTGWTVTAGYFFKDTMFYSGGRGGPAASAGKAIRILPWLGLWVGGGVLEARGTMDTSGAGSEFRTRFDASAFHFDIGVVTPWLPFPVSVALYRHSTGIEDTAVSGALAGRRFAGSMSGWGVGINVRVMFEFFLSKRHGRHRGLGIVGGYAGFMDLSPRTLRARDSAGGAGEVEHRGWKPFKGEGLQLGLEYEF